MVVSQGRKANSTRSGNSLKPVKGDFSESWEDLGQEYGAFQPEWVDLPGLWHELKWALKGISGSVAEGLPSGLRSLSDPVGGGLQQRPSALRLGRSAFRAAPGRASPGAGLQRGLRGGSEGTAVSAGQDRRLWDVPRRELCFTPAPPDPGGTCCWRNGRAAAAAAANPPSPPPGPHGGPFDLDAARPAPPLLPLFLFFFFLKNERKISPQPSPVTCGPRGGSCGFRERRRGPAGRRRRRRRRRPTWRRAGLGRAAAAPERPTAVARLAVPTPAPNLARRPRSAQPRSARARPGAGTAQRQRRWARQAPDPQLRCSPAGGARRPEPWNRRRSST